MRGEKSPRLSGQVLPGYSLLITSRCLAGWIVMQAALRRFLYAPVFVFVRIIDELTDGLPHYHLLQLIVTSIPVHMPC
ncbi:hypothetical protein EXD76_08075 [BEV proteobacterium]|nr:hypothetical protein [Candidatus Symbiopectobacterium sp. Chty_BC]